MDKESILRLSRKENEQKQGEFELSAYAFANKISSVIGGWIAAALSLLGWVLFDSLALSAGVCTMLFAMNATSNIVLYKKLKRKVHLIWAIAEVVVSIFTFLSLFLLLR